MDNWKQNLIDSITKDDQITYIKFCTLLDQNAQQIEQQLIESIGTKSAYSSTTIQCLQKQFQQQQPKQQKPRASKNVIKNILLKSESKSNILPKQVSFEIGFEKKFIIYLDFYRKNISIISCIVIVEN